MTVFTSVGIVILAMLIMASLQLTPGIFLLFYHSALGKYSKSKASLLALFYFLGVEAITAFLLLSCFLLTNACFLLSPCPEKSILAWIVVGVILSLTIVFFFFYFRNSKTTALFISRNAASKIQQTTANIKTNSDAFILGASSTIYELFFTMPLYIIVSAELMKFSTLNLTADLLALLFILMPITPLVIIYAKYQTGLNTAEIQKQRIKNIPFTKFIVCLSYLTIAILLICFRINEL